MKKFFNSFLPTELVEDYIEVTNQMTRKDFAGVVFVIIACIGAVIIGGYIDSLPY